MAKLSAKKIDPKAERHGKAVAIELWEALDRTNDATNYRKPATVRRNEETFAAYLRGFSHASPAARRGFVRHFADFLAMTVGFGTPNAPMWGKRHHMRPELGVVERKAHARAWLKGGAA